MEKANKGENIMKPIIAMTTYNSKRDENTVSSLNMNYSNAILKNGGIPLLLPIVENCMEEYIDNLLCNVDGVLFSGGADVSPIEYNEEPVRELGSCSIERDKFEILLYKKAFERKIPILGICRGLQVINVAAGGTLYQDIYTQKPTNKQHNQKQPWPDKTHKVNICADSKLYNILEEESVMTNSFHHQAAKDIADGFYVSAKAEDDIVEAIEYSSDQFVLGVQWHPEGMFEKHHEFSKLFKAFIKESELYKNKER